MAIWSKLSCARCLFAGSLVGETDDGGEGDHETYGILAPDAAVAAAVAPSASLSVLFSALRFVAAENTKQIIAKAGVVTKLAGCENAS